MEIASTTTISAIELINLSKDIAQLNLSYLGISVAILSVLGGVFYFFNIKPFKDTLNKQEKTIDDLRKEADKLLDESKKQSEKTLKSFEKEQSDVLLKSLKQQHDKIISETENKITSLENDFLEKIESVAENKDVKLKEIILSKTDNLSGTLEKSLSVKINNFKNDLNGQITETNRITDSLKSEIKDLKRDIKELLIYKYAKEGKMGSIIHSIELLKGDIDEKSWRIPNSLEALKKYIKNVPLDADYITQIEEQLIRIEKDKKYNILIKEVKENYAKK